MYAATTANTSNGATIIPFPSMKEDKPQRNKCVAKPHEAVEPIKDTADIEAAKNYLLNQEPRWKANPTNLRNYMMFVVNINNALRISDLLDICIDDILVKRVESANAITPDDIKEEVFIRESKTGKTRYIFFGQNSKEAICAYINALPTWDRNDFLFASRQRDKATGRSKAITRQMAWTIINKMGKEISKDRDKQLHLGPHSMRKTFGYQRIKANPDNPMIVAEISEIYNHSDIKTTYRYLGIDTETKKNLCIGHEL